MKPLPTTTFLLLLQLLLLLLLQLPTSMTVQTASPVPLVQARWGDLQGVRVEGEGGRTMAAYLGVPYAEPPVGLRRWEKPVPHPGPGEGVVFRADKIMPACPQIPVLIGSSRETSEDCLMLDVYVPEVPKQVTANTDVWPVMVFIHGGGYYSGDAHTYRPSKLVADGKVIVVIIQYRLEILGFLTSGDDTLPGNLGMWDQIQALRWVKENIRYFGGDSDRITLFGQSSGSWSVGLHLIMPQSKGLFHRAIMQSGAPQDLNRFMDFFGKEKIFKDVTDLMGCDEGSNGQRLQCLKQQPLDLLMAMSQGYVATSPLSTYFLPVVDGDLILGEPRQLLQDPAFLQQNGVSDIDLIMGFNRDEGSIVLLTQVFKQLPTEFLHTRQFFAAIMDMCFIFAGLDNIESLKMVTEFFYRGAESGRGASPSLTPVADMLGDCLMNVPAIEWAQLLLLAHHHAPPHRASRYLYVLDHEFAFNSQCPLPGAHHIDDLLLLFDVSSKDFPEDSLIKVLHKTSLSPEDQRVSDDLVRLWTTFAQTGKPQTTLQQQPNSAQAETRQQQLEWPLFTAEEQRFLSLSGTPSVQTLKTAGYSRRVALWRSLLPQLQETIIANTTTARPTTTTAATTAYAETRPPKQQQQQEEEGIHSRGSSSAREEL